MYSLKEDAKKAPFTHVLITVLFFIGIVSLPLSRLTDLFIDDGIVSKLVAGTFLRLTFSVFAVIWVFKFGFGGVFGKPRLIKGAGISLILAFAVAVNNAPIIGFITGNVTLSGSPATVFIYLLYCLSVATAEELVFRGVVFPLCVYGIKKPSHTAFYCIFISSAIFALTHLANIFSLSPASVALQVGYSFLIGALCACCTVETGNVVIAVLIHFVYDVGGLALGTGVAFGNQWDLVTIIITAVLGVAVAVYFIIRVFGYKINQLYFFGKGEENEKS